MSAKLKVGVPVFSYANFTHFEKKLSETGVYSINLGDYMQTLAIRRLLRRLGLCDDDIISVDRDRLTDYDGPELALVMNAVFVPTCFPLPQQITPVFVGFSADAETVAAARHDLEANQPIGCRDHSTTALVRAHGIEAYTSHCLTLTIDRRGQALGRNLYIAYGEDAGAFPWTFLQYIPDHLLDTARIVSQRLSIDEFPLCQRDQLRAEAIAEALLETYARDASLVVTSLHHAATPAMAMGIPVLICRTFSSNRFDAIGELTPVYLPPALMNVRIPDEPVNVDSIRAALTHDLACRLHKVRG